MKLNKETAPDIILIDACDALSVTVRGAVYETSVLVSPTQLPAPWPVARFDALDVQAFEAVLALRPAVVLIGTGARQYFPAPSVLRRLIEAKIGFEVMNTGAACRTYNLLAAEGRAVLAVLIVGDGS